MSTKRLSRTSVNKIHAGGIPTDQVKELEAQAQGFQNKAHYWAWFRVYLERKRLG